MALFKVNSDLSYSKFLLFVESSSSYFMSSEIEVAPEAFRVSIIVSASFILVLYTSMSASITLQWSVKYK